MKGRRDSATVAVAIRYAAFAALATFINVATQVLTLTVYEGRYGLQVAMAGGTVTGLVTKYLLDRKWIFGDRTASLSRNAARFVGYSATGVLTTGLFWAVELGFAQLGDAVWLPFTGAVLGLALGYTAKYQLDKHFVFVGGHA